MNGLNQNLIILTRENFDVWYDQLTQMLYGNKVGDLIERVYSTEDATKTEENGDQGGAAGSEPAGGAAATNAVLLKLEGDELIKQGKANYLLSSTLNEEDRRYVMQAKTVKERIDLLKALRRPAVDVYSLYDRLSKLELKEPIERFISDIEAIRSKVQNHPNTPNKDETPFVQKLLKSLPKEMNYTRLHYEREVRQEKGKVDWTELVKNIAEAYREMLEERESRAKAREQNRSASGRASNTQDSVYFANVQRCFQCGSVNHRKRFCPQLQGNTRGRGGYSRFNTALRGRGRGRGGGQGGRPNNNSSEQNNEQPPANAAQGDQGAPAHPTNREARDQRVINNAVRQPNLNHVNSFFMISSSSMQVRPNQWVRNSETNEHSARERTAQKMNYPNVVKLNQFIYDNGSDRHVVNNVAYFTEYKPFVSKLPLDGIDKGHALGIGTVAVVSIVKGQQILFNLKNVYYIPTCPKNIFSEGAALDGGLKLTIGRDQYYDYKGCYAPNGDHILTARRPRNTPMGGQFVASLYVNQPSFALIDTDWHAIMGCADYNRLYKTVNEVEGMKLEKTRHEKNDCSNCLESKMTRRTFNHQLLTETEPGKVLHADVDDLPIPAIDGSKHFITFTDEATRYRRVYFLKDQNEKSIWAAINQCLADQYHDLGRYPTRLHTDRGASFMSAYVKSRLATLHIVNTPSSHESHEQNGLAEKTNRDIMDKARAMLNLYKTRPVFWREAVDNAVYVMNRTYVESIGTCPYRAMFGRKPSVKHLKPFGCPVYVYVTKQKRGRLGKLRMRGELMQFLGHTNSTVNFKVAEYDGRRVFVETNCQFPNLKKDGQTVNVIDLNRIMPSFDSGSDDSDGEDGDQGDSNSSKRENSRQNELKEPDKSKEPDEEDEPEKGDEPGENKPDEEDELNRGTEQIDEQPLNEEQTAGAATEEQNFPADREGESSEMIPQIYDYLIPADEVVLPRNFREVASSPYAELIRRAMDQQFLEYLDYETWVLVDPEPEAEVLRGHWLFDLKPDEDGFVKEFKTRWVIDGSELDGAKYAPVVNMSNLRLLLAIAAKRGYHVHSFDVKNAYLNSLLNEKIYMKQITGYVDTNQPEKVCLLKKSLFGLPMSAANWFETLTEALTSIGLQQSILERCIYFEPTKEEYVAIHVDDGILITKTSESMARIKSDINEIYPIKDNGELKSCLGMEFEYDREGHSMKIKQTEKINELYEKFKVHCKKANKLPIQPSVNLYEQSEPFEDPALYMSGLGSVNHLATHTRPDVTVYCNQLAVHMKKPTKLHFRQLCMVISYLYETRDEALCYDDSEPAEDERVYTFVDAGELYITEQRAKRTTGIVCTMNKNPIHWMSKKQTVVTKEICQGELYALNAGLRVAIGFRNLMAELKILVRQEDFVIPLLCDNSSAVDISTEGLKKERGYDLALLTVLDYLERTELELAKVESKMNLADMMTKFLAHQQFAALRPLLNLKKFDNAKSD